MTMQRALQAAMVIPWAIQPESLQQIIDIASGLGNPEAVAAKLGRPLSNTHAVTVRDGVAVLPVVGPIFHRANLFTEISGATSVEIMARDFQRALDDPTVNAIVLDVDSPGGQADGVSELADMIRAGTAQKHVVAYVSAMGASGGYWLASAASEVVINKTAMVGSIGVVMGMRAGSDKGRIEIVSSNAPNKRIDPTTDTGRAQVQALVDRLEQEFVGAVATYRGVTVDTVLSDFGQGGMLIGSDAVAAGMADRVGTLESVIAGLSGQQRGHAMTTQTSTAQPVITIDLIKTQYPDIAQALRAEGEQSVTAQLAELRTEVAQTERARIQAVFEQGEQLPGHEQLIKTLMFDGKTTGPEAAVQILAAEKAARGSELEKIKRSAPTPVPSASTDPEPTVDDHLPVEERCKIEWERSSDIRAEFGDLETYTSYKRAEEAGRIRVLRAKTG